ncbi:hemerythrin domain-containing protein [Sulfitobacter sp. HGT1]|uniref:hemerythrin domain-containing protein n=1 Tax=Sulfitobacter sp. HGT1 TaxID=2735435 RepID=UPI0020CDBCF8|nr:hemerythrin domain-containing protein [Sulfitobacter sp. HGT1]
MTDMNIPQDLLLSKRDGLPDALRALIKAYPRAGWVQNPNYSQLIAFWLDRHMMFRRLLDQLDSDVKAALDGAESQDVYKRKLHRFGGMLINELHGHHQIEDAQYFPVMAKLEKNVERGFDILDTDHHALDGILSDLATSANGVLQHGGATAGFIDAAAAFKGRLDAFHPMLNRHLTDEEELVVPVLLKYDPPQFR